MGRKMVDDIRSASTTSTGGRHDEVASNSSNLTQTQDRPTVSGDLLREYKHIEIAVGYCPQCGCVTWHNDRVCEWADGHTSK